MTLPRQSNYAVEITDASMTCAWKWLRVLDLNGAVLHTVVVRDDVMEIAREIAIAVERAESWRLDERLWAERHANK